MSEESKNIIFGFIIVVILGLLAYAIYDNARYEKECTYETETTIGIVSNKERNTRLACAKPVVYRTVYETEVTMPDGEKTTFSGSTVYSACEIGDEILIEVERKYHNGELVGTDYKTVDSKQGD